MDRLREFARAIAEANARVRLVGWRAEEEIWRKGILFTLEGWRAAGLSVDRLVDVGAGAGIVGVTLALADPDLRVVLVEARRKKVAFLREIVERFSLPGVTVLEGRAEELVERFREAFPCAVARGLAETAPVLELLTGWLEVGGWAVLWKPPKSLQDARRYLDGPRILGLQLNRAASFAVQEERGIVWVWRKVARTGDRFPRPKAQWKKRPIFL